MKGLSALALSGVLLFFVFSSASPAQTPSGPSMVLPEKFFDFREVEEGKPLEHSFKVLNKGDQTLQITNVNPG
jgi:hypothetical protein